MSAMWIVTANSGHARFFSEAKPSDPLEEVGDMVNEAVRLRAAETEYDRLGPTAATKSTHNTGGQAPNKTYEPHPTPHEHEAEVFAKNISDFLLQGFHEGRFGYLTLVASPEFLGELRMHLDPHLKPLVKQEIKKDYTKLGPVQLREQIAQNHKD